MACADQLSLAVLMAEMAVTTSRGSNLWPAAAEGVKHDLLYEQDRYRDQFWAAFDAFIPGSDRD